MHIFFVTLIIIQIFDIVVIVMVFVGEVAKLKDFNFAFWMELEIMSELLKCALLIVYCYHVARKKVDLDELFEPIEQSSEAQLNDLQGPSEVNDPASKFKSTSTICESELPRDSEGSEKNNLSES